MKLAAALSLQATRLRAPIAFGAENVVRLARCAAHHLVQVRDDEGGHGARHRKSIPAAECMVIVGRKVLDDNV